MKHLKIPRWPLLVGPGLLFLLGFLSNSFCVSQNNNLMPVYWPGGCYSMPPDGADDLFQVHSCMTHASHWKFLADWIVIRGLGVASPGDFLLWAGEYIWLPCLYIWAVMMILDHHSNQEYFARVKESNAIYRRAKKTT